MPEFDNEVAEEVDDTPNWVKEGTEADEFAAEGEDIHGAEQMERSDVIEPAKGVELVVKSVRVDQYVPDGKEDWKTARLELMLVVGEKGVDGKGRYKNKHFFPRILFAVNRAKYDFSTNAQGKPTDYYSPSGRAFGDYNAFLKALGLPTNPAPKNDAAFRKSLVGKKLIADITKDRKQVKDKVSGKYEYVNEYENGLLYKPASAGTTTVKAEVAEAAAS